MSNFICQIFNESGDRLRINLSQSHPAWMDMLNLLCGAKPLEWIDDSSHNNMHTANTGDASNNFIWVLMLVVSVSGMVSILFVKRNRNR